MHRGTHSTENYTMDTLLAAPAASKQLHTNACGFFFKFNWTNRYSFEPYNIRQQCALHFFCFERWRQFFYIQMCAQYAVLVLIWLVFFLLSPFAFAKPQVISDFILFLLFYICVYFRCFIRSAGFWVWFSLVFFFFADNISFYCLNSKKSLEIILLTIQRFKYVARVRLGNLIATLPWNN